MALREMLLPVHIVSGGLAIVLGAIALIAPKGSTLHRRSGLLFVFAMLAMGMSGSVLALGISLTNGNVTGGFISAYFVVTALTTVRRPSVWTRRIDAVALAVGSALSIALIALGVEAFASPRGTIDGAPYVAVFFLATIITVAVVGDIGVVWAGALWGRRRLARHLWRMCFALFIAAGSFFSIRARVARILPVPFTTPAMRAVPILLLFIAMFYWLWRVRRRGGWGATPDGHPAPAR